MADLTFATSEGQTIDRELLIAYLNTGTSSAPVWSAIGKRVEDSTEEMDWGAGEQAGHSRQHLYHHEKARYHADV